MEYTKDKPLRVFEAFAGYGSQSLALKRLKEHYPQFDYEGNVDGVLYNIFRKMFIDTESESQQLSLF